MTRRRPPKRPAPRRGKLRDHAKEVVGLLVLISTLLLRERQPVLPPRREGPWGGSWLLDMERGTPWWGFSAPARPIPTEPFEGQKRPPCTPRVEEAINGGCWAALRAEAPCPPDTLEHAGRCYLPVRKSEPLPTSLKP